MPGTLDGEQTSVTERIQSVGDELAASFQAVLDALPGRPSRPNQLSRDLGLNRDISSRLLAATTKRDPMEVTHVIPGPEPLRAVLQAAAKNQVDRKLIERGEAAVRHFEDLIRNDAGTRGALDAIISSMLPSAREKLELTSKYSIFKGMSQLKGVQAETWLGAAVVTPSTADPDRHDLTWLTGAIGIQRLRPDVTVRFSYRALLDADDMASTPAPEALSVVPMDVFCTNPPAQVETHQAGKVINYTLPGDRLGPQHPTDMLVVDHHPATMRRYAKEGIRNHTSLFVEPAFPVTELVFDMLLHEDAFPGSDPTLVIYDTGTKGIANVNDPTRDIDRMDMQEKVEFLSRDMTRFGCSAIAHYTDMLRHLSEHFGWDPTAYRGYRCRMQYPVYGWQIAMSFRPPAASV